MDAAIERHDKLARAAMREAVMHLRQARRLQALAAARATTHRRTPQC